jgi:hypothetical protein
MFIVIANGSGDRGFDKNEPNSFIRSPINIRKVMLSPTENKIVSVTSRFLNPNPLRRIKPGIKMK